ncbi:MAG: transposase zinc-binding domain-containing protein [Desulfobacteraceae bacterium]
MISCEGIRCPDCGHERLLAFSCRGRWFCPSCHGKRTIFSLRFMNFFGSLHLWNAIDSVSPGVRQSRL